MRPWELIWPKPHFLFNCRSQGHFPIWILQMLLNILMSYTFYQTLTFILRARKWFHNVRGSQEIAWRLLVLKSRHDIWYMPLFLYPPWAIDSNFPQGSEDFVLLCLQNLCLNVGWHHSSSILREAHLFHICRILFNNVTSVFLLVEGLRRTNCKRSFFFLEGECVYLSVYLCL